MRKFSKTRRRLKQAGLVACVILLIAMAGASIFFVDYARVQPPSTILALVIGWFALIAITATCVLLLLRDWHRSNLTPFCPTCEYDLSGNESGVCPECGNVIPDDDLTLSGRPPLFNTNPLESIQEIAARGHSTGTKLFLLYFAYVTGVMIVIGLGIWFLAHLV